MNLWIDFETYSAVNIKLNGGYRYCVDPSTKVLCLGWAIDDGRVALWVPGTPFPPVVIEAIQSGCQIFAHNAMFDYRIWNDILIRDFPDIPSLNIFRVTDTAGLSASFSLPLGLEGAGAAMGITMPKNPTGRMLIKLLCTPDKAGLQPRVADAKLEDKFQELYDYCIRDVEAMREFVQSLPRDTMTPLEARIWRLTQRMNTLGLPVAYDEVEAIKNYLDNYIKDTMSRVPIITRGMVQTTGQVGKIRTWCADQDYPIPNLQTATVVEALDDPECPADVRDLLFLRQELGRTSTAKYKKILELAYPGRHNSYWVHDNLVYHGAGPGRWTGRGFQMQNLPRASVPNPEEVIAQFKAGDLVLDPVTKGKALIRPMIKAPTGYSIIVSDFSSIENRVLHWLAGDTEELNNFRNGVDQYKTMASALYEVPYGTVDSAQRKMGKVIILGCGYMMGANTFRKTAKLQFQMDLTEERSKESVAAYREKYPLVVALWKGLKDAAIKTVISGQKHSYGLITFGTATIKGTRWLAMELPNGKCIYYKNPRVEQKFIPKYEYMGRVPTATHEGWNGYSRKWTRLSLSPGRITENADQGTAREMMATGLLNIQDQMKEVQLIGTVHDEGLGLIKDTDLRDDTMERFDNLMCDVPWASDVPIEAKGYIATRYRKE